MSHRLLDEVRAVLGDLEQQPSVRQESTSNVSEPPFVDTSYLRLLYASMPPGPSRQLQQQKFYGNNYSAASALYTKFAPPPLVPEVPAPVQPRLSPIARDASIAFAQLALRMNALRETANVARCLREKEESELRAALTLLNEEIELRQRRCNAIHSEMKALAAKKLEVLAEAVTTAKLAEGVALADGSSASSRSGPTGRGRSGGPGEGAQRSRSQGGASTSGGEGKSGGLSATKAAAEATRGMSPGNRAWAKVRAKLLESVKTHNSSPQRTFACGPLTKAASDKFSTVYGSGVTTSTTSHRIL